jgi:hypothetical protein
MRKSDKLKNFKKINLIVENRYLESKGIIKESIHDEKNSELEEGFLNRLFDISSKENEANKQKAIEEITHFNFESLFYQPSEGQALRKDVAEQKVADAARAMPTVKQLNPMLFELKGGYFSNATVEIGGKLYRGVIPSCFESIRDVNDKISNDEARKRTIGYLG